MPIQPAPRPLPPTRLNAVFETRKIRASVDGCGASPIGVGTSGAGACFFGTASIDMREASWPRVPRGNDWPMVPRAAP